MRLRSAAVFAVLAAFTSIAPAQQATGYPSKPVRIVVPFPPGGATDVLARTLAPGMNAELGQPIIVDNRPGAAGIIGTQAVAKEKPDGYTLLLGADSFFAVLPHLQNTGYDPFKDFVPVAPLTDLAFFLAVHASLGVRTLSELIALARAQPGKLSYASPGVATPQHLAGELFAQIAAVQWVHVPYKGGAPAVNDFIAGQVPVMFGNLANFRPHIAGGKIRLLGIADPQRFGALPEVPAIAETLSGFTISGWFGVFAPAGTGPETVARIGAATDKALRSPEVLQRLDALGFRPLDIDRAQFAARIRSDYERMGALIRSRGIKGN